MDSDTTSMAASEPISNTDTFDKTRWTACCNAIGVSFARKGTPEYDQVIALFRDKNLSTDDITDIGIMAKKSPSPRRKNKSPRRRKSLSPRRCKSTSSEPDSFDSERWTKACQSENVRIAKKGTRVYQRVLARYQGQPVLDMPVLDTKHLPISEMVDLWDHALNASDVIVLLKGGAESDTVIRSYISLAEDRRVQNKTLRASRRLELKTEREEKKRTEAQKRAEEQERINQLSPRSRQAYTEALLKKFSDDISKDDW